MQYLIARLTWIVPLLWVVLCLFTPLRGSLAIAKLRESVSLIEDFRKIYHRLPLHLGEVRAFARAIDSSYTPYDSYAMRLRYMPLTDRDFLVKSFGQDEQENLLNSAVDHALSNLELEPGKAVLGAAFDQSVPQLYQPALLSGSEALESSLVATLLIHQEFRTRQLLVRSPSIKEFYLVAFHDMVEEFFWLPSGKEIIFSASGSQRYEDGIFYWNLQDNSVHNLLPDLVQELWPKAVETQGYYISLSHISPVNNLLYILITPKFSSGLDPKKFYSFKNLIAIPIDAPLRSPIQATRIQTDMAFSAFDYPISQQRLVQSAANAAPNQQDWLALRLDGDAESIIDQWQNFSSTQSNSPMFPYGLWWLASIYNDSFRFLQTEGSPEAPVIRNFGIEIAEALHSLPTAPPYLKAMGLHIKKQLLLSKAADYNVSSLSKAQE